MLRDDFDSELHAEETRLGIARTAFETGRSKLYLADGRPNYAPHVHEQKMEALYNTLDRTVATVAETANDIVVKMEAALEQLVEGDPLSYLSTEELAMADARRVFIAEDVERLTPRALAARATAAITDGDRPTAYLLARYVGQRLDKANEAAHRGERAPIDLADRQRLSTLVEQLRSVVRGPDAERQATSARERLKKARALRTQAAAVYDSAHGTREKRVAELRASGKYLPS